MGMLDERLMVLARKADGQLDHGVHASARRQGAPVKKEANA